VNLASNLVILSDGTFGWDMQVGHKSKPSSATQFDLEGQSPVRPAWRASSTQPLQVIHSDLVGPITPATNGGARYFLKLVNQYSGHISTKILRHKSNALEAIKFYIAYVKCQKLMKNGGREFVSRALFESLTQAGIQHKVLPPYTPQLNGFADRSNHRIIKMTHTLLLQANMAP
jgi:transposase InsO family protein